MSFSIFKKYFKIKGLVGLLMITPNYLGVNTTHQTLRFFI